jgi:ligand-binding SRPBCC domain-containing protein
VHGLFSFTVASTLRAPADRVWDHASSFAGINRELWPLVRMTHPHGRERLTPETVPLGRRAFRSWLLLFGLVPVDYDDLTLIALDPGRGFHEVSRLFSASEWRHRRTLTPVNEGCVVEDEVTFVPRWRWAGPLLAWVYRQTFELRHRNLRRLFRRHSQGRRQHGSSHR